MGEEEIGPSSSSSSSTTEKQQLKQAIFQISALISLSHSIRVFTAKWQSARSKLEELISNLAAIENCELGGNPSLSAALEKILTTLTNCEDLAKRCSESSYSGKLLMQSDLDVLSATLDAHIGTLRDIYAAGLLEQSHALVVSRPSPSASWEDVRFYLNDVVSRLKIGSKTMKREALVDFNEVIREDERYIKIGVELDGFLNLLVNFLDFHEKVQEEASKAVYLIADFPPCKTALVAAGAIAPLIRVVECGSEMSKEFAARCLMKMTENSDNVWAVSAHGGVPALLKICGENGGSGSELVCLACGVLKNLVAVEEIKRFMVEDGAVAGLVELAGSRDEAKQISALDLLQTMAYRDESIRETIITYGGIRILLGILDPAVPVSTKTREVALRAMMSICLSWESSIVAMMSDGFGEHILHFLRFGEVSVQEVALKAAFWLCGASEQAKKMMGDAGLMPLLLNFLDSKSFEIREIAAETLSIMLLVPKNRKKFVQKDQNVAILMQMLDPEQANSGNQKLLLSILMSLTHSNSARKKILSLGYLKNIEKLAEDEASDAKKIVRKLSSSRFRSVFNVFWHS